MPIRTPGSLLSQVATARINADPVLAAMVAQHVAVFAAGGHPPWPVLARPEQLPPLGAWLVWYIQAGRGWGKTRTGAEWLYAAAAAVPRVAIVAESFGEGRDTCVEGESGIKTLYPGVRFNRSLGELYFPSGARGKLFSADDPESLRGPNNYAAWCDEIAKWRYLKATWDNLMFTMRRGEQPRTVVTTTPKPLPFLKALRSASTTHLTRGTTYDNMANLSPAFVDQIIKPYEGTTIGRQELNAEDLDSVAGALWTRDLIDDSRRDAAPVLERIVTAIDPSATAGGDEAGIVTGGMARCACKGTPEDHAFILADDSTQAHPREWARRAVAAYHRHQCDSLIAEDNNGGEMVEVTISTIAHAPPVRRIHATRGKYTRAEPVAMLYEQGKVHHIGAFPNLEDELCTWAPGAPSPNRLDALVWCVTELLLKGTPGI